VIPEESRPLKQQFYSYPHQRFFFLPPQEPSYEYKSSDAAQRARDDAQEFNNLKNDLTVDELAEDDSLALFCMPIRWWKTWQKFAN
jgi:ubiquitin C-terminal hydrolase